MYTVVKNRTVPIVKGLPVLGRMPAFRKDMVAALNSAWQEAGDIFDVNIGPRTMRVISDPKMAQEILIEKKQIFQRPRMVKGGTILAYLLGQSVLTIDGDSWLTKRRMIQPIFHKQRIAAMGDTMADAGADMLKRWEIHPGNEPLNLGDEMKLVTLDIINRTMFSTDILPEVYRIGSIVDIGLHYISDRARALVPIPESWPTPANRSFQKAKAQLDEFLYAVIRARRQSDLHPSDLLDMLLAARDEDTGEGMNDEQIRNEVATIYGAGHETTAVALTWTWYALNQNPEILKKLQDEIDRVLQGRTPNMHDLPNLPYTCAIFDEALRYFPPVPMTVRLAYEASQVSGYDFPKGTFTAISIYNLHFHPDHWNEPQRFMPERFLPENKAKINRAAYIPFLTGPHLCIGNNFALMEGPLLLAMMAQHYSLKLLPNQKIERDVAITMRPKYGIKVQRVPRNM